MIVVDSSVWINQLRKVVTPKTSMLRRQLRSSDILVGDLILMEVLQGCRTDTEADGIETILLQFELADMVGEELARQAAHNYRHLRQRGITIRSPIDVMIATYCMDRGYALLTEDRDFKPMAQHLGLRLIE
ncbi:PIN domain nuclease [Tianweitania populi]|uniref:Ribonuclease VapC n=1 Tax=Tianweitania populi TaxID=1607949 RepID=A0A8J3GLF9_9HYPH|nr:PIN domain nuclease [Tianweitania populi]GHD18170.1 ribonuclease VapC [Tianweitania populi]